MGNLLTLFDICYIFDTLLLVVVVRGVCESAREWVPPTNLQKYRGEQ